MYLVETQAASAYNYCRCLTDGVSRQMLTLKCALFHA